MREIQATEAKARLAELLRNVEHGKTIAHLIPAYAQDRTEREAAVDRFLERRAGWRGVGMSLEEILALRHEGHRV